MKTYQEILNDTIEDYHRHQIITSVTPETKAAKEYAKQYLQQVATKLEPYDNGYDLLSQIPYRLMDEIDAQ